MLETKYYKDFRHNYIILKLADSAADLYQCRMITGNQIEGLLPCKERHINGEILLYYEITSKAAQTAFCAAENGLGENVGIFAERGKSAPWAGVYL